ncbi:MAG: type III-A CRISPR-associated RAMP protein Csm5 [Thermoplasmata archaeon]|nr:type III-A CRISPR-associated RAMP protein Csm5 [Thermoplasmata archaeon]
MIFGKDPNHDLMRAFHVSDTERIDLNNLRIENVRILSTRKIGYGYKGFNIIIEALRKGTIAYTSIKIDNFLMEEKEELGLNEKMLNYLYEFGKICNEYAKDLIEYEMNFFTKYNDGRLNQIIDLYEELYDEADKGILLRLAWGTGWHGMAIGRLLEEDALERLRKIYSLGRRRNMPYFVKPFPKTRKIVFEDDMARYPLGWIKLEEIK